jgi:hypothetical protein
VQVSEPPVVNKLHRTARGLAAVFLGILFGLFRHSQQLHWAALGRQAYLAEQNHQFDVSMSPPHNTAGMILAGVILAAVACGIYELLSAGIASILPRHQSASEE